MTTPEQHDAGLAERYVARQLDPAAAAAFEDHMLLCERCQAEIRLAAGLRTVARETTPRPSRRALWTGAGLLGLAAAASALLFLPARSGRGLAALGAVSSPPAYEGAGIRAASQHNDSLFVAAMNHYAARRYSDAAALLRRALAAGADSTASEFFLGSAELMNGRASAASEAFTRVIDRMDGAAAYLGEAYFFRAKAFLQLGRADDALADLERAGSRPGATPAIGALADSVVQWRQR